MVKTLIHTSLAIAILAVGMTAMAPAQARIRSADAIGQCLDAEGGPKQDGNVIAFPCYYGGQSNNQQFVLDWLTPQQTDALWPSHRPNKRSLALIRVGEFCVTMGMKLTRDCPKDRYSASVHWAPLNVGGNRYSMRDPIEQCLVIWGGSAEAIASSFLRRPQEVRYRLCIDGGNSNHMNFLEHGWQFWYVEQ